MIKNEVFRWWRLNVVEDKIVLVGNDDWRGSNVVGSLSH